MLAVAEKCEVGVTFNSIKMDDTAIGTMSSLIVREVNFCFHHAVSCTWMNSAIPFLLGLRLFFSWIGWPINRGVLDVKFYFSGVQYVDTAIQIKLWRNLCWYFSWRCITLLCFVFTVNIMNAWSHANSLLWSRALSQKHVNEHFKLPKFHTWAMVFISWSFGAGLT